MRTADAVDTLTQRRNWLTARIAAKQSVGWDVEWDTRERDALTAALALIQHEREAA
jgi:hypothetical protein